MDDAAVRWLLIEQYELDGVSAMFVDLDDLVDDLTRFVELDADHWRSDEGFIQVADLALFYRKFDDVIEFECEGVVIEAERYCFIPN